MPAVAAGRVTAPPIDAASAASVAGPLDAVEWVGPVDIAARKGRRRGEVRRSSFGGREQGSGRDKGARRAKAG